MTRRLTGLVSDDLDEQTLARLVCEACVDGLDVDGASISVSSTASSRRTLWATDTTALLLEEIQITLNEGVCVDAASSGTPVLVDDLTETAEQMRWPAFTVEVAERTSARALLALPLQWGAATIGVLDLYRLRAGPLTSPQWQDLLGAAAIAGLLLLGVRTRPAPAPTRGTGPDGGGGGTAGEQTGDRDGWPGGDDVFGHPEIHQATGMVLVQLKVGPEEALARMRAWAFAEQRLLIEVARDVVARRLVFTEEMR